MSTLGQDVKSNKVKRRGWIFITILIILVVIGGVYFYSTWGIFKLNRNTEPQLELISSIDMNTIKQGENVTINIGVYNNGPSINLNSSSIWPTIGGVNNRLSVGPCAEEIPLGIAIISGYYTDKSIISSKPLILWFGIYMCQKLTFISHYEFFGHSNLVAFNGNSSSAGYPLNMTLNFSGYYHETGFLSGVYHFTVFPKGVYTVVFADEWGASAILHFYVT